MLTKRPTAIIKTAIRSDCARRIPISPADILLNPKPPKAVACPILSLTRATRQLPRGFPYLQLQPQVSGHAQSRLCPTEAPPHICEKHATTGDWQSRKLSLCQHIGPSAERPRPSKVAFQHAA